MSTYDVKWGCFGIATVEADSEKEAAEIVSSACFGFDDMDFEDNQVDGVDIVGVE